MQELQQRLLAQILAQGAETNLRLELVLRQGDKIIMDAAQQKAAIEQAIVEAQQAILDALTKEKDELIAQILALKVAKGLTDADVSDLVNKAHNLGLSGAAGIDALSDEDGATDPATGPTAERKGVKKTK